MQGSDLKALRAKKNTKNTEILKILQQNFDMELKHNERLITISVASHIKEFLTYNYKLI